VIKSENGNVFGGYTEKEWHSKEYGYVTDPSAFIFSLVKKDEKPFKVNCSNGGRYAIYCSENYGPVFGDIFKDIVIRSDSNTQQKSYSGLGYEYKHTDYPQGTVKAYTILAGSVGFHIEEIEVYSKTD